MSTNLKGDAFEGKIYNDNLTSITPGTMMYRGRSRSSTQEQKKGSVVNLSHSARPVRESGNFLLVEFGILGFGFQNKAQGIRNPTIDWIIQIPSSSEKDQNQKSAAWYPESKTYLGLPYRNVDGANSTA